VIEQIGYPASDRAEIVRDQHSPVVLGKKMRVEKILFPHRRPPPNEQFAQRDKKDHVHDVLNRERVKEMQRRMIQNQDRRSPGEHQSQKPNEEHAGDGSESNRGGSLRLLPESSKSGTEPKRFWGSGIEIDALDVIQNNPLLSGELLDEPLAFIDTGISSPQTASKYFSGFVS
jgi:hypothetical protein